MRVKVDDLGMDFSMAKGLLAAHRISAHPWFSVFYVFSVTASAVVRGFCSYWPGPDSGFLSPLMVLGDGRWFRCLRGF